MSQPQQPGGWSDPSWPSPAPGQPSYPDPTGYPAPQGYPQQPGPYDAPGYPTSGQPAAYPTSGQPAYPAYGTQYPPYGGYPMAPAVPRTNGMAIAAMVCALAGFATCISAPVGAVLGHVARRQIRERGEAGDGFALTGIIVGWILTGLLVAYIAFIVIMVIVAESSA